MKSKVYLHKRHVPEEQKKHFGVTPSREPDKLDFEVEHQNIIIDLYPRYSQKDSIRWHKLDIRMLLLQ
jgi:hypothetical protein